MNEKYYVVSESELKVYRRTTINQALTESRRFTDADKEAYEAEAACRARPIKKVDGPFIAANGQLWEEDV